MINAGILTISDKGSQGQRQDKSGEVIREILSSLDSRIAEYAIVPDEAAIIAAKLAQRNRPYPDHRRYRTGTS